MNRHLQFYIDGEWVAPSRGGQRLPVINPATEKAIAEIALGSPVDVDRAVAAARRAFADYAHSKREVRLALLQSVIDIYERRQDEIARTIALEIGAPLELARQAHAPVGLSHLKRAKEVLAGYPFDETVNGTVVTREPVGVCALITPWNWPMNQVACKVGPALAAGCTMVLKPSELAPLSALLFAEILEEAGVPRGVFNLVNGDGPTVGQALAEHPDVDMVSFTGSTRAGVAIAKSAADTVKRVHQELGGKSPSLVLEDADLAEAVSYTTRTCFRNSGQSCNAPTRLLVPAGRHTEAVAVASGIAEATVAGDPFDPDTVIGPVVSRRQYDHIQTLIRAGMGEGATLVAGGLDRPEGMKRGFFLRPTVFADVRNDMRLAREEIFGPVLAILPYESEEEAICIANDTEYGLSAYVASNDVDHARAVARRLRTGMVHINGARSDVAAAFGGYKRSGNGREWGRYGFEEFLEIKSMFGY
ncbi:aldehyde dehydrogenase family protein [Paraburkholderia sp. 1N]|uniref:aldehyde dehydrogenase (NAD(+)) n=1 Tax=Paraburkholderia solitsugae TaxID=2675748 RepID=A0ABX2BNK4_9BURK|nr:aldehyde dehydrogenase family protein [Paraburkholderia solitsugae]NPT42500.1 aldehyde dehydrogenase family protein [Paraburkholderia solitsugae]